MVAKFTNEIGPPDVACCKLCRLQVLKKGRDRTA
jgi:hypothetical protein